MSLLHQQFQLFLKRRLVLGRILTLAGYRRNIYKFVSSPPAPITLQPSWMQCRYINSSTRLLESNSVTNEEFNEVTFEHVSNETLESLNDRLEELIERPEAPPNSDVALASGVLTLKLGDHGTYVINKQTPNKQIWLSSPFSGPKRYDFRNRCWTYKYEDEVSLHSLLSGELSNVFHSTIDLSDCNYGGKDD